MTQLITPTDESLKGIWLLDEESLQELDGIIDDIYKSFEDLRKSRINNAIRKEKRRIDRDKDEQFKELKKDLEDSPEVLQRRIEGIEKVFQDEFQRKEERIKNGYEFARLRKVVKFPRNSGRWN